MIFRYTTDCHALILFPNDLHEIKNFFSLYNLGILRVPIVSYYIVLANNNAKETKAELIIDSLFFNSFQPPPKTIVVEFKDELILWAHYCYFCVGNQKILNFVGNSAPNPIDMEKYILLRNGNGAIGTFESDWKDDEGILNVRGKDFTL